MFRLRHRLTGQWVRTAPPVGGASDYTASQAEAAIFSEDRPWMWDSELETIPVSEAEKMRAAGQKPLFDLEAK